jgi:signal transduction histidine kinase
VTRFTELVDEIAAERAKLHSLIMQLPVAVALFEGADLTLRAANPAFERLIPNGAVAPGTPSGDVLRKLHGAAFVEKLAECQRIGDAQSVAEHPATIAGLDGESAARVFTTSFAPLRDHAGRVTGVVSAGIDLTDQAEARSSLEASIRFAEEFVGIVSHDLRNPLTAISIAARRLKARAHPGSADHRTIDMVVSGGARMTRMVEQLMDLSHARLTGTIPVDKRILDVATVLEPVVEELRLAHPEQEIHWDNGRPGLCLCLCDGDRIAQVASNLISNAVEHGGRAGPVRVSLNSTDDSLAFTVHNNGPSIAPEMLPAIFDPIIRRKESKGLGLGLYIAQQIVEAHDGRIEVTSNAQDGTTFRVLLPRTISAPAADRSDAPAQA